MFITGELPNQTENTAVALGCFDGLHLGHMAVIDRALAAAGDGLLACVFTFAKPGLAEELMSFSVMEGLLAQRGVGLLVRPEFESIRHMTPREFVDRVLIGSLHAKRVVCGYNYRFGQNASGDASALMRLCEERGIAASIIPPIEVDPGAGAGRKDGGGGPAAGAPLCH